MNITFKNPDGREKGVRYIIADGTRYDGNLLPRALFEGKKQINILAIM